MNFDKRYCQHRVRKRKKVLKNSSPEMINTAMEDERQFKLNRFVKDVTQFMENKGHLSEQKNLYKENGSPSMKPIKKTKTGNLGRRGLFQNGIQTKFYSRGIFGKDRTARLDGDLQQIISLANKGDEQKLPSYRQPVSEPKINEPLMPATRSLPRSRTSSHHSSCQTSPPSYFVRMDSADLCTENDKSLSFLDKLDSKLYLDFTRIVTLSSIESKSIQFKNKSYVAAVKTKLMEIHQQQRNKEISRELSCLSDVQKSSVATSPLQSLSPITDPQLLSSNPQTQETSDSEQGFDFIQFRPEPLKSTTQFLEETIGTRSICKKVEISPEPQVFRRGVSPTINTHSLSYQHGLLPRRLEYCEPPPRVPSFPPSYNLMMPFDGGGDRHFTYSNNLFLPTQEESPEFQYYPRRMF